jgi:hypothetical protein
MRKHGIVGVALVLVLVSTGITVAEERPFPDDILGDWQAATDQESHSCLKPSTLQEAAEGSLNVPATCENGDYLRYGFSMGHGFSELPYAAEAWSGHVDSWLRHEGQDRGFRCTFNMGALQQCRGLGGVFPNVGAEFSHECLAYERETGNEVPIAVTNWGCRVFGQITRLA